MYDKLQNLNNLRRNKNKGIYKQWIYYSNSDFHLACDYIQKINNSIMELNEELLLGEFTMKNIVYIISLVDWIKDSYSKIIKSLREEISRNFIFTKESELKIAKEYFVAIRSYVVAHPMNTTNHSKFGFDGDFICINLTTKDNPFMNLNDNSNFFYINYNGLHNRKNGKHHYYLRSYSNNIDNSKYYKYISFDVVDIIKVAELYIHAIYELDNYLSYCKKKNMR